MLSSRRAALAALVGLCIIIGTTVWFVAYHKPKPDASLLQKASQTAQAATVAGDYTHAYAVLQKSEANAKTTKQKVELYGLLAAAAANVDKPREAINYYVKRHELDPSTRGQDAELLAALYERVGETKLAVEQYKLAREYFLQTAPLGEERDGRLATYDAIIRNLETAR